LGALIPGSGFRLDLRLFRLAVTLVAVIVVVNIFGLCDELLLLPALPDGGRTGRRLYPIALPELSSKKDNLDRLDS
jgi:hypothetical protein